MKKFILIMFASFSFAQQTATDTEMKVIPMDRMRQEMDILNSKRCYQLLLREENIRLKYKPGDKEKNTPATRMMKALQVQFYLEKCTEKDKADFKEFQKIRY